MPEGFSEEFPHVRRLVPVRTLPAIRLDRAQAASATQGAVAASFSDVSLYNNAQQSIVLVVRSVEWGPSTSGPVGLFYRTGTSSANPAISPQAIVPDRAVLPGQIYVNPDGAVQNFFYQDYLQSLGRAASPTWPFAVLPPNWSLRVESTVVNVPLTVSFIWEALTPEEFVESYGVYV